MSRGLLSPKIDGQIDAVCPVNWLHPLNRDRAAWLLTIPEWHGSPTNYTKAAHVARWTDLVDPGPDGSHGQRVIVASTPPAWVANGAGLPGSFVGAYRPGGRGGVLLRAADSHYLPVVDTPKVRVTADGSFTLAAWVYQHTSQNGRQNILRRDNSLDVGSEFRRIALLSVNAGNPEFLVFLQTTSAAVTDPVDIALLTWYRLVGVRNVAADTISIYVNGVLKNSATDTTPGSINTTRQPWVIGRAGGADSTEYGNFILDDLSIINRAWSPADVAMDYELSKQGYPGLLNRVRPWTLGDVAPSGGGGGFQSAWAMGSNVVINAGAF